MRHPRSYAIFLPLKVATAALTINFLCRVLNKVPQPRFQTARNNVFKWPIIQDSRVTTSSKQMRSFKSVRPIEQQHYLQQCHGVDCPPQQFVPPYSRVKSAPLFSKCRCYNINCSTCSQNTFSFQQQPFEEKQEYSCIYLYVTLYRLLIIYFTQLYSRVQSRPNFLLCAHAQASSVFVLQTAIAAQGSMKCKQEFLQASSHISIRGFAK